MIIRPVCVNPQLKVKYVKIKYVLIRNLNVCDCICANRSGFCRQPPSRRQETEIDKQNVGKCGDDGQPPSNTTTPTPSPTPHIMTREHHALEFHPLHLFSTSYWESEIEKMYEEKKFTWSIQSINFTSSNRLISISDFPKHSEFCRLVPWFFQNLSSAGSTPIFFKIWVQPAELQFVSSNLGSAGWTQICSDNFGAIFEFSRLNSHFWVLCLACPENTFPHTHEWTDTLLNPSFPCVGWSRKNEIKSLGFWRKIPYGLWLTASGARWLRGWSPFACRAPLSEMFVTSISSRGTFKSLWDLTEVSAQSRYKVRSYELVNPTFKISLLNKSQCDLYKMTFVDKGILDRLRLQVVLSKAIRRFVTKKYVLKIDNEGESDVQATVYWLAKRVIGESFHRILNDIWQLRKYINKRQCLLKTPPK